jgi:hypothetical protein
MSRSRTKTGKKTNKGKAEDGYIEKPEPVQDAKIEKPEPVQDAEDRKAGFLRDAIDRKAGCNAGNIGSCDSSGFFVACGYRG